MKAIAFFLTTILFVINSWSCKPDHVKVYERLEGVWQLENLRYTTSGGEPVVISNPQYKITFIDKGHKGTLSIDENEYPFSYNFGDGICNLAFQNQIGLPSDAIGKVNMYAFSFYGKKNIKFNAEEEYNYVGKESFYDVEYTFTKL